MRLLRPGGIPAKFSLVISPPYASPVRHAMLGVGGVGGPVGAALARAGEEVTLLMRPESLDAYSGVMHVDSAVLGDFEVEAPTLPLLADSLDVLWVTTKGQPVGGGASALAPPDVVNDGRVVTLMNGVDHLRLLQQRYPIVIGGAMRVESERVQTGPHPPDIAVHPR